MKQLILASSSPRRKELLKNAGIPFTVVPSSYEEVMDKTLTPEELVKKLSLGKAEDVAKRYANALILSGDTFVIFENTYLGKPKSYEEAISVLEKLRGRMHSIISGFAIIDSDSKKIITGIDTAKIFFNQFSSEEIKKYLESHQYLDKAGSYAIQEIPKQWIEKIEGNVDTIIGLPVKLVTDALYDHFSFTY